MRYITLIAVFFIIHANVFAGKTKVKITYSQSDVNLIYNNKLSGDDLPGIKIDFSLGGTLIFYKTGYFSKTVEIDPDKPFTTLKVNLSRKSSSIKLKSEGLLKQVSYKSNDIIPNYDDEEVKDQLVKDFSILNVNLGINSLAIPDADTRIDSSKYDFHIELVNVEQIQSVYKYPKFMMSKLRFRWTIKDKETKRTLLFKETEGIYFVKVSSTKGLIVSKKMLQITKEAIEEAVEKLVSDKDFKNLL